LSKYLLSAHGVGGAFRILGAGFTVVTLLLAGLAKALYAFNLLSIGWAFLPLAASGIVVVLVRVIIPVPISSLAVFCYLGFTFLVTLAVTIMVTPFPRTQMVGVVSRLAKGPI